MDVMKTLDLSLKDVYQLLIGEMRYGYTRNNHLMPSCGYDKAYDILPRFLEVDKEYALHTAKQLCDECISDQIVGHFYNGIDDEFGNLVEARKFVRWLLNFVMTNSDGEDWFPYNYDMFVNNLAKDDEPRYLVYEEVDGEKRLLTETPVSLKQYPDYVFAKENLDKDGRATYHHIVMRGELGSPDYLPYKEAPIKFELIEPVKRTYIVELIKKA